MPEKVTWGRGSKQSAGPRADFGRQIGREAVLTPVCTEIGLTLFS